MSERVRVVLEFPKNDPASISRAKQGFKNEVDINTIMAKAKKTGLLPVAATDAFYGDFSSGNDFLTVQNRLLKARDEFNALSAAVRSRFENDPAKMLDFLSDPANEAEAIKLGLRKEKPRTQAEIDAANAAHEAARMKKFKDDLRAAGLNPAA